MTKSSRSGHQRSGRGGHSPWSAGKAGDGGGHRRGRGGEPPAERSAPQRAGRSQSGLWLYGTHAVIAALANPARYVHEVRASARAAEELPPCPVPGRPAPRIEDGEAIARNLPTGAVHQGLAARVEPLDEPGLIEALTPAEGLAVMLDQVSDPQNVGAIFRTAAAFGAKAVIQQDRNSPPVTGALAKAAAGGLELVPDVRVVNLSQAIRTAQELGWRVIGLAGESEGPLPSLLDAQPTLLVLGAEGRGLRDLVARTCDGLGRIEIDAQMESLNVSVATGIALAFAAQAQRPAP